MAGDTAICKALKGRNANKTLLLSTTFKGAYIYHIQQIHHQKIEN